MSSGFLGNNGRNRNAERNYLPVLDEELIHDVTDSCSLLIRLLSDGIPTKKNSYLDVFHYYFLLLRRDEESVLPDLPTKVGRSTGVEEDVGVERGILRLESVRDVADGPLPRIRVALRLEERVCQNEVVFLGHFRFPFHPYSMRLGESDVKNYFLGKANNDDDLQDDVDTENAEEERAEVSGGDKVLPHLLSSGNTAKTASTSSRSFC